MASMPKRRLSFALPILVGVWACVSIKPSLTDLVETRPDYVITKKDSILQQAQNKPEIMNKVMTAYIRVAQESIDLQNYEEAVGLMDEALSIDKTNKDVQYTRAMALGLKLFKKGSPNQLWDAIEQFSRASYLKPEDAVSMYWMAKGYAKKDDEDFSNIIELYTKAIELGLPEALNTDAIASLEKAQKEKQLLESFWK